MLGKKKNCLKINKKKPNNIANNIFNKISSFFIHKNYEEPKQIINKGKRKYNSTLYNSKPEKPKNNNKNIEKKPSRRILYEVLQKNKNNNNEFFLSEFSQNIYERKNDFLDEIEIMQINRNLQNDAF